MLALSLLLGVSSPALPGVPAPSFPVLSVTAYPRDDLVVADLELRWDRPEELVASLLGGLESRLVFTVQLYEKRSGFLAFRGDRRVAQATVVRRAYRDILTQMFVVDEEGGARRSFATTDELMAAFFTVDGLALEHPAVGRPAYVAARAQLEPVRLMPPLTLVILAGAAAYATPWVRSAPR